MSADNEIAILEMIDKDGHREYLVADNVSMSYNLLGPDIDLSVHWQGPMVYRIWRNASRFYHRLDSREYARKLEENGYYEYGTGFFKLNGDWDDVIKANEENECPHCHGDGTVNVVGRTIDERCETCKGSGLKKDYPF